MEISKLPSLHPCPGYFWKYFFYLFILSRPQFLKKSPVPHFDDEMCTTTGLCGRENVSKEGRLRDLFHVGNPRMSLMWCRHYLHPRSSPKWSPHSWPNFLSDVPMGLLRQIEQDISKLPSAGWYNIRIVVLYRIQPYIKFQWCHYSVN